MPTKLFAPFEIAVQNFHAAGGATVFAIRVPSSVMEEFLRMDPVGASAGRYMDVPVQLTSAQQFVSIRGKSITGKELEVPHVA